MKTFLLTVLLALALPCTAQKALRPVRTAMKDSKYKEAIALIAKLRNDTLYRSNPKLCLYAIEANRALNDAENTKLYLKQNYDTIAFFSTTAQIIAEAVRLDSIEKALWQAEERKPKHAKTVCENLQTCFPNLLAAGRYYYRKAKFSEAMPYLRTAIELPQTSVGKEAQLPVDSRTANACLYLTSAYNTKNFPEVHRYEQEALQDTASAETVMRCLLYTSEAESDDPAYQRLLQECWMRFPAEDEYFIRLVDHYRTGGRNSEVVELSTRQLKRDTTSCAPYMARCIAHFDLKDYDACIADAQSVLRCDTTKADAYYYVGASYVEKAEAVQLPEKVLSASYRKAQKERRALYLQAEKWLEDYRRVAPDAEKQWAPLLYKVYLALNRGKKFAEIEKLCKE